MLEMAGSGGLVRRNGRLVPHTIGTGNQQITFSNSKTYTVTLILWGDLANAQQSTGYINVTTSMAIPIPGLLRLSALSRPIMQIPTVTNRCFTEPFNTVTKALSQFQLY